jgi:hypothetical protein
MTYIKHIGIGLCTAVFLIACAADKNKAAPGAPALKGFLGDYSHLESVKGEGGEEIRRWTTSKNIKGKYLKMIVDPVAFYPEPAPSAQVSLEAINEVRNYTDSALRTELSKSYTIVHQVGPGVARVRLALTGVTTAQEGLAVYEYIPVAAILAGVSKATGQRDENAFIMVEGLVTDSQSGEKLGMAVRKFKAKKQLEDDKQKLTAEMMKPIIDVKVKNARTIFDRVLK